MFTSDVLPRSLRRPSRPISCTERTESDQSLDSGFGDENEYTYQDIETIDHASHSPESTESSATDNAHSQFLDECPTARKRVSKACDFCRRKKCKVH